MVKTFEEMEKDILSGNPVDLSTPTTQLTEEELLGLPPKPQMSTLSPTPVPNQSIPPTPLFNAPKATPEKLPDITKQAGYRAPTVGAPSAEPQTVITKQKVTQQEFQSPISAEPLYTALEAQAKVAKKEAGYDVETAAKANKQLEELTNLQSQYVSDWQKARDNYNQKIQDEQKQLDDAANKYSQAAIQNKGFWAVSDTPQKISSGLNLLSAALYTFARQPDRADKAMQTAYGQMQDAINNDLKLQQDRRNMLKEALSYKYDTFKNKSQLLRDDYLDSLARQKAGLDVLESNIARIKQIGENQKIQGTALDKIDADIQAKKADISMKLQEANRVKTQTSETEVPQVIAPNDLKSQLQKAGIEGTQKLINDAETRARGYRDNADLKEYTALQRTNDILENALKTGNRQGLSVTLGKFIAKDLEQGSFNTQLADMLVANGLAEKAEEGYRWVIGRPGELSEGTIKSVLAYTKKTLAEQNNNPRFQQVLANAKAAENTVQLLQTGAASTFPEVFTQPEKTPSNPFQFKSSGIKVTK